MQNPTHVELTILEAQGLALRGKYDTNDAFAVVGIGKDKFTTAVLERKANPYGWENETFLLEIPRQGNTAAIQVSIYHRKRLGDECLGLTSIFLHDFQPTVNPKLMTYALQGKSDKFSAQGQVTVKIVFKTTGVNGSRKMAAPGRKSIKNVAQEIIQSPDFMPKRTMSFRNIAQVLLAERKMHAQCTKALPPLNGSVLDSNENEIGGKEHNSQLIRVQSARGKINTRREIQMSGDRIYIRQKVIPRPRDSSSSEEEDEEEMGQVSDPEIDQKLGQVEIFDAAPKMGTKSIEGTIPFEFRGETKSNIIEMVLELRKLVKLQNQKIEDLEDYIDGRLAEVMEKNPGALEIEN